MTTQTIQLRAEIDDYTSRVLGVIKERFGLKDKSQALMKLAHMFGEEFVPLEMKEEAVKNLILTCNEHVKKYGKRKMTLKELDKLCE
jgi:hypothetical protein